MRFKLFKQKDFSIYIVGKFISVLGSNIMQFALALYVFAITNSAGIFATILAISIIPRFIFSPFAGVFGDWFDRKKMIIRLDFLNAAVIAFAATIFIVNQGLNLAVIIGFVLLLEAIEIFYESSSAGILPSIIKKDDLLEGKSYMSMALSIGRLAAPMIGASLYGVFGLQLVLIINAISFFIVAVIQVFMHVPAHHVRPEKLDKSSFIKDFKEGLAIIKSNDFIRTIISIGVVINFVFSPILSIGIIVMVIDVLEGSEVQYGLFQTVMTGSMFIGPIIVANFLKKADVANLCFINILVSVFILMSIAFIFFEPIYILFTTQLTPFVILLILAFLFGVLISIVNVSVSTLFAQVVPLHLMGRTATAMNLLITAAIPIGQVLFGFLFDFIPVFYVIMLGSTLLLIALMRVRKRLLASTKVKEPKIIQPEVRTSEI